MAENQLEKLAESGNYEQYLKRMTASVSQSSKGLIPFFIATMADRPGFRILDVGCGSGVLMKAIRDVDPEAEVIGVDLNGYSVAMCRQAGFGVFHGTLHDLTSSGASFDCILFSSVLHEISSYDEVRPFSFQPIADALADAWRSLAPGGRIVIRDGAACPDRKKIRIIFRDPSDAGFVKRFADEFPAGPVAYELCSDGSAVMEAGAAKEFLYTYTWGPDSWPREVREKFGIAAPAEWQSMIRSAGFRITMQMSAAEEYLKYLGKKVVITPDIEELFEQASVLFIAEKGKISGQRKSEPLHMA